MKPILNKTQKASDFSKAQNRLNINLHVLSTSNIKFLPIKFTKL